MVTPLLERVAIALLARMLPAGFRDRQRAEWRGDLAELARHGRASRLRYLAIAALTLPSLHLAARRGPWAGGGWAIRPQKGSGTAVPIALLAVTAGMFAGAAAGRLTWTPPPPMMSAAQARELAGTVFPGRTVTGTPAAPVFDSDVDDNTLAGATTFEVSAVPLERDFEADLRTARDRLRARGWTVDTDVHDEMTPDVVGVDLAHDSLWRFTAHRDHLTLDVSTGRYRNQATASYLVRPATYQHLHTLPVLAAGAPATLAAWLAACRLHRRAARRRGLPQLTAAAGVIVSFAVLPMAGLLIAAPHATPLTDEPVAPWWYTLLVTGGDRPYVYATLVTVLAIWLAGLPGRPATLATE
ncbi:hypothetical protein COUCH_16800 [Couchioplanes caeruleus]|uniref:hypothetical protein n=1 Tax=Couchioplanes caeruleus TaxID=56438 RepID=UPI0020C02B26|nr:hypothetical protein [Couchioplanes caeruleus]UQU67829.1 hypothetical protein COUCH_16800 [Couchioplanes caeruleus]